MNKGISTLTAIERASLIVGTPLVLVAKMANSPRHAARIAAFLGCNLEEIQATRWAAVVARRERNGEEKAGFFEQNLGPIDKGDYGTIPNFSRKTEIRFEHHCETEGKWQPLNSLETSEILAEIRKILHGKGLRLTEISNPAAGSHWPSKLRWNKGKK